MPALSGSGRGDLIVTFRVHIPTKLSAELRRAMEVLAELEGTPPEDRGFFERVKEIFG